MVSGHGEGQTSRDRSSCLVWERGGSRTCNLILKPQSPRQTGESRAAWPNIACRDSFWEILSVWLWEPGTDQGLRKYLLNRVSLCLSNLVSYSSPLCSFCSRHMVFSSSSNKLILKKRDFTFAVTSAQYVCRVWQDCCFFAVKSQLRCRLLGDAVPV